MWQKYNGKMEKEYLKEIGKQFLNLAIGIVIFAVVQPLVN